MIEVGEYVRDKGEILQVEVITNIKEDSMYIKFKEYEGGNTFYKSKIKEWKHSKNIIDLIEVGDYVNGHRVEYIDDCVGAMRQFYWFDEYETNQCGHYFENSKSIVTKEQFTQMEYKVKE